MPIPVWCWVLGGIILFIAFLLSVKINLVLVYDNRFSVYIKILFFKIWLFPEKQKKKPKKAKKEKPSGDSKAVAKEKKTEPNKILKILTAMKDTISDFISDFFGKVHFKLLKIYASIGCEDACKTALAYGSVTQSVGYIIELLNNVSNVDMSRSSDIDIRPDFISQKSWFEAHCVLYLRVASLFPLGIKAIKAFFKYKNLQEKLSEVDK